MKNYILLLICLLGLNHLFSQSTAPNNQWLTNRFLGFDGSNGVNPLFFRTNAVNRMKINGNLSYTVNGYNATRNGNVLIGVTNNTLNSGLNMYTGLNSTGQYFGMGAYSLLHLNGAGPVAQEYGYRPWMDAGVTLTGNRDFSYFGLLKVETA